MNTINKFGYIVEDISINYYINANLIDYKFQTFTYKNTIVNKELLNLVYSNYILNVIKDVINRDSNIAKLIIVGLNCSELEKVCSNYNLAFGTKWKINENKILIKRSGKVFELHLNINEEILYRNVVQLLNTDEGTKIISNYYKRFKLKESKDVRQLNELLCLLTSKEENKYSELINNLLPETCKGNSELVVDMREELENKLDMYFSPNIELSYNPKYHINIETYRKDSGENKKLYYIIAAIITILAITSYLL